MGLTVTAEGPTKITRATIEAAWRRRRSGARLVVRDAQCRGLALVVNAGAMAWRYDYRPRGINPHTGRRWPSQSITIGNPATHDPDSARREANRIKGQAAAGGDPAAEKRAQRQTEQRKRAGTLSRLVEEYATALPRRPKLRGTGLPSTRHVAEELAHTRAALKAMDAETIPAADLTTTLVRKLVVAEAARPATARARFGALSRFLDWCQDAGHVEANPCALMTRARRPRAAASRSHYLTIPELARLWHAAAGLKQAVHRDLARFLIAVPCRRGEAVSMEWQHVDLNSGEWRQPGQLTKNEEPHRLHLHPLAVDLLRSRHAAAGQPREGVVFASARSGEGFDAFTRIKGVLVEGAKITGWRWHDFRRSFATALGEAGVSEAVADAVLNHKQSATRGGVLGVYQRATRWPEQVRAMHVWGERLTAAVEGRPITENVVPITRELGAASG